VLNNQILRVHEANCRHHDVGRMSMSFETSVKLVDIGGAGA
jgi:hypothetical protein